MLKTRKHIYDLKVNLIWDILSEQVLISYATSSKLILFKKMFSYGYWKTRIYLFFIFTKYREENYRCSPGSIAACSRQPVCIKSKPYLFFNHTGMILSILLNMSTRSVWLLQLSHEGQQKQCAFQSMAYQQSMNG